MGKDVNPVRDDAEGAPQPQPGDPPGGPASPDQTSWHALESTLVPTRPPEVPPLPAATSPQPGVPSRIGDFQVVRLIGRGGMGTVYEVVDQRDASRVALKTLRSENVRGIARFLTEFHTLASLRHVNLVRIFELGWERGEPYFTMELLSGVSFQQWIGPVEPPGLTADQQQRLRGALSQLVAGLNYLHQSGYLHRDLKPSNVFVLHDGTVRILDFGLSVPLNETGTYVASMPGVMMGTLAYMAPEQARGEDLSPAADWYSVGVMLFECLTGRLPFVASTLEELQRQKLQGVKCPPDWSGPQDLMALAVRLLDPLPERRPDGEQMAILCRTPAVPTGAPSHVGRGVLIGREHIQQRLAARYETTVRNGGSALVLISGPSGMGKSECLRWFAHYVRSQPRAELYAARCYETVLLPYKALDAINVALAHRLAGLPESARRGFAPVDADLLCELWPVFRDVFASRPLPRRASAYERRRRAFAAYKELLTRWGPHGPDPTRPLPVFLIDDLQWGDVDSAALLAELLSDPPPAMFMVWAYRCEDERTSPCLQSLLPFVASLAGEGNLSVERIAVERLTTDQALQVARRWLAGIGADPPLLQQLVQQADGNPLLLRELCQFLRQECGVGNPCQVEPAAAGVTLEDVVRHRMASLSQDARLLLEMAAVAGRPVPRSLLVRACGVASPSTDNLDRLLEANFLRISGGSQANLVDTFHDRIREAVYSSMPLPQRHLRHSQLAEALAAEGTSDAEFIGSQWLRAGRPERAGRFLAEAADRAAESLAFDHAVRLYQSALQCPQPADRLPVLRAAYAQALANTGRCAEAANEFLQAAQCAPQESAWDYRCHAARYFLTSGHTQEGLRVLDEVLGSVGLSLPQSFFRTLASLVWWRLRLALLPHTRRPAEATRALVRKVDVCWSAVSGLSLLDPFRAAAMTHRLLYLAERLGEPNRLLRAYAVFTAHASIAGTRSHRANRLLDRMRQIARQCPGLYAEAVVSLTAGIVAHLRGQWQETWTQCDRAAQLLAMSENPDVTWELDTAQTFSLWARLYGGQLHDLAMLQPLARRSAIERDDLFGRWNFGARVLAMVGLMDDRVADVTAALADDERLLPSSVFHIQHHNVLLAHVLVDLYQGHAREAWERMKVAWRKYRYAVLSRVQQVRTDFWKMYGLAATAAAISACPVRSAPYDPVLRNHNQAWLKEALRGAQRSVRQLQSEHAAWASALACLLQACVSTLESHPAEIVRRFDEAARYLETVHMDLFAQAASYRRDQWRYALDGVPDRSALQHTSVPVKEWQKWLRWLAPAAIPEILSKSLHE